jgi:hypothetical protein
MKRHLVRSAVAVASVMTIPMAALATVYTINVPVAMSNMSTMGVPMGTVFSITCSLSSAPQAQPPWLATGVGLLPPISTIGGLGLSVPVAITPPDGSIVKSYSCSVNPKDTKNQYAPPSTPTVTGVFPVPTPVPARTPPPPPRGQLPQ